MSFVRIVAAATTLLLAPALAGCSAGGSDDGRPEVVAAFYPLQFVADRVVGEHATVTNLTDPGVEPHDLELTPRQVARLSGAAVGFYEHGLQPAVDQAMENNAPEHVVDVAEVVTLHAPADEHAGEGEADHEHEHGALDPHFWLDPTLLARTADAFTDAIAEADPAHAEDYRRNNTALQKDLTSLDEDFRTGLAQCRVDTVVVSHDAFGYLGERYGLDIASIAGLSPDAEPSPKRLAELADLARRHGVTTIFSERLASPKLSETLAGDLGLSTAVLDPIEGLTSNEGDQDYLSLMRANLSALRKANSCS
jgi:zinc transport system substrate-binding protein